MKRVKKLSEKQFYRFAITAIALINGFLSTGEASSSVLCEKVYFSEKPVSGGVISNINSKEDFYVSVYSSLQQGVHSTIFVREWKRHTIGKMISKISSKSNHIYENDSVYGDLKATPVVLSKIKNLKMQIKETRDQVRSLSLGLLAWNRPFAELAMLPDAIAQQNLSMLADPQLGVHLHQLLSSQQPLMNEVASIFVAYEAYLIRDLQIVKGRQMVLRFDLMNDETIDEQIRKKAIEVDQQLEKLAQELLLLRTISEVSRQVALVEQKSTEVVIAGGSAGADPSAIELMKSHVASAQSLQQQVDQLPLQQQKIFAKLKRTLLR